MNGAGRASLLRRIQAASKNDMELDHALKAYGAPHRRRRRLPDFTASQLPNAATWQRQAFLRMGRLAMAG